MMPSAAWRVMETCVCGLGAPFFRNSNGIFCAPSYFNLLGRMDNNPSVDRELDAGNMLLKKEADNRLLLRRGTVGNDRDGTPLLINGRGEAYRVNDTAISLWHMCNGITFDDLFLEVLRISSGDEEEVKKSLEQMVRQFQQISVIELRD